MHVALIIDEERLGQEQAMLNRLAIGLMAEGVQVTRIVPDSITEQSVGQGEQRVALAARIEAPMRVLPWMKLSRVRRIVEEFEQRPPEIVYAIGARAWWLGLDLGAALGAPALLDVCSMSQARSAPRAPDQTRGESELAGYVAPSRSIADALGRRVDPSLVSVVPMGVSLPPHPRHVLSDPMQAPTCAVVGGARDLAAYTALLAGLRQLVNETADLQIFLELRGPYEHDIWLKAERMELAGCISAISDAPAYRDLLTRCDLLLAPERLGEPRSIILEAMALGIPIIAGEDPALDVLVADETALLVKTDQADEWAGQIRSVLQHPERARQMGWRARQAVTSSNRSSDQVARLIWTLERTVGGETLRFERV